MPLLLRSGDVMVLSGAVRTAVHGVARAFHGTAPAGMFGRDAPAPGAARLPGLLPYAGVGRGGGGEAGDDAEEAAFAAWIAGTRVNINLRQVEDAPAA